VSTIPSQPDEPLDDPGEGEGEGGYGANGLEDAGDHPGVPGAPRAPRLVNTAPREASNNKEARRREA
jgi:hypothetical protein